MNYKLLLFIGIIAILVWGDRIETSIISKDDEFIDKWVHSSRCLKQYNPLVYNQVVQKLGTFKRYLRTIKHIQWHNIARHKRRLPDLTRDIVNTFQSMVHSLPVSEFATLNKLLKSLHEKLYDIGRKAVVEFYDKCPQIADRLTDYDVHKAKDFYIHDYFGPRDYDPMIDNKYDFYT